MAPTAKSKPPSHLEMPKGHYTVQARDARALERARGRPTGGGLLPRAQRRRQIHRCHGVVPSASGNTQHGAR
eukprot:scaffold102995_cov29-Tisochrysis_lutea.AAC.1